MVVHIRCFAQPPSLVTLIFTTEDSLFLRVCRSEESFQQQCPPELMDAPSEHLMDVGQRQGLRVGDTTFFLHQQFTYYLCSVHHDFLFTNHMVQ